MKRLLAALAVLLALPAIAQMGSGTGSFGTIGAGSSTSSITNAGGLITNSIQVIHTNTSVTFYTGGSAKLNGQMVGTAVSNLVAGDTMIIGPGYYLITNAPFTIPPGLLTMPIKIIGSGWNTWLSSANAAMFIIPSNVVMGAFAFDNTNRASPASGTTLSGPLHLLNANNFIGDTLLGYGHFDVTYHVGQADNQILRNVQFFENYDWANTSSVTNNSTAHLTIYNSYFYGKSNLFSPNFNDGAARHCLIVGMTVDVYGSRFENGDNFLIPISVQDPVGLITTADDVNSSSGGYVDGAVLNFIGCTFAVSNGTTAIKNLGLSTTNGGLEYPNKVPATINLTAVYMPLGTNLGPVNFQLSSSVPVTNVLTLTPIPNWTNLTVTGTSDANGRYINSSGNPNGTNGLATWTNTAVNGQRIYRNDAGLFGDVGGFPPELMVSNATATELYYNTSIANAPTNYLSFTLIQGNGASVGGAFVRPDTNGFTTNYFFTPSLPLGVTDGNLANAGNAGEVLTNGLASSVAKGLSTGTAANITNISLTAGEWDVSGTAGFTANGATVITSESACLTTSTATLSALDSGDVVEAPESLTGGADNVLFVPTKRIRLTATTTVFLVGKAAFSVNTLSAYGFIRATRVR